MFRILSIFSMVLGSLVLGGCTHMNQAAKIGFPPDQPIDAVASNDLGTSTTFLDSESAHDGQLAPWQQMRARLDDERSRFQGKCKEYGDFCLPMAWESHIEKMRGMPMRERLDYANRLINEYHYAVDSETYGIANYWSTPLELATMKRGDCKDHAIAKFAILMASGIPEESLRVLVLHNTKDRYLHAILMVSTAQGLFYLDDQKSQVLTPGSVPYYHPIYSINFDGWWLHEQRMAAL